MRRSCETDIPQEFAQCKVSLDALDVDERRAVNQTIGGKSQLSCTVRTVDPSFKAGVAPFSEERRSWSMRGGRWAREVGGKQEV